MGIIKVPVMHLVMGVPLRTSTATSNMMMGITATASAVIYLLRDEIDPFVAGPIALGVFVGASAGLADRPPGRCHGSCAGCSSWSSSTRPCRWRIRALGL